MHNEAILSILAIIIDVTSSIRDPVERDGFWIFFNTCRPFNDRRRPQSGIKKKPWIMTVFYTVDVVLVFQQVGLFVKFGSEQKKHQWYLHRADVS